MLNPIAAYKNSPPRRAPASWKVILSSIEISLNRLLVRRTLQRSSGLSSKINLSPFCVMVGGEHYGLSLGILVLLASSCSAFHCPIFGGNALLSKRSSVSCSFLPQRESRAMSRVILRIAADDDFENLTVAALRERLDNLGDKPPSKMRKAELIERLQVGMPLPLVCLCCS